MVDNEPQINFDSIEAAAAPKRRTQLMVALMLLLTALTLVVLKNREFWSDLIGLEILPVETARGPVTTVKKDGQRTPALSKKPAAVVGSSNREAQTGALSETQTIPSPLRVDVTYSSGLHQTLLASNSAIRIDPQQNPQNATAVPESVGGARGGGVQVRFSGQAVEVLGHPAEPVYPLMAQRANVQGAVVLRARIKEDGSVDGLEVVSGPSMLTSAALEAVRQWQFRPRYEGGKAVATETRITVNFTISTQ